MNAHDETQPGALPPPRPPYEVLVGRALRLRCPRCGRGRLFAGFMRMHNRCDGCGLHFQRGPGYYLGSTYINYGITAGIVTAVFVVGQVVMNVPGRTLLWPLFAFCLIFPVLIFRHARALWLALDCHLDRSVLEDEWQSGSERTPPQSVRGDNSAVPPP